MIIALALLLAACGPRPAPAPPAAPPFPSITPGAVLRAPIPPLNAIDLGPPSAAVAAARPPSATPDLATCPPPNPSLALAPSPPPTGQIEPALVAFLNAGGTPAALRAGLAAWGVAGDGVGGVYDDLDLTGEGANEIIISYLAGGEGALLIVGCVAGAAIDRYRAALAETAPQIISAQDANLDGAIDLLFAAQTCPPGAACLYRVQLVTWAQGRGRFVNLISDGMTSDSLPTLDDIDSDRISEIIARQADSGDAARGPRRTGFTAWDWDGASYRRALTQLDPPRYRIQAVHDADAAFESGAFDEAISLYRQAADDSALEDWLPDDGVTLRAYALYRLMVAYAAASDPRAEGVQQRLLADYPDVAAAPVYVAMGLEFWNGLDVTGSLSAACGEALDVVAARLEAVGLLNRYGAEAPAYTAGALCPF